MNNLKRSLALFSSIILSHLCFGQSLIQIENVEVNNQFRFYDLSKRNIASFHSDDLDKILESESVTNQVPYSSDKHKAEGNINLLIGLKRRNKVRNQSYNQAFSFGFGYTNLIKNAIQFYKESPTEEQYYDGILANLILSKKETETRKSVYEIHTKILSFQAQEIFWISNGSIINLGIGLKTNLGFELDSKLIKREYTGSIVSPTIGKTRYSSYLNSSCEHNSKKSVFFSGGVPIKLSIRLSKDKSDLKYNLKLITSAIFGIQKNITSNKNRALFSSYGFSLRYEL